MKAVIKIFDFIHHFFTYLKLFGKDTQLHNRDYVQCVAFFEGFW